MHAKNVQPRDGSRLAEDYLQRALEEPLARHIRAIERELRVGTGLLKINVEPDPSEPAGRARLMIRSYPSRRSVTTKLAWIVYGVKGLSYSRRDPGPTFTQSEQRNAISVRLAIAHELAHLVMGHCATGKDGELEVPEHGFTEVQDQEACAYAVHLVQRTSEYLEKHCKVFYVDGKALTREVHRIWKAFWKHKLRRRYRRYLDRRDRPWDLDP